MCNTWCLEFVKESFPFWPDSPRVLEVGARDVNGSVRAIGQPIAHDYIGVDIKAGKGVDAVIDANDLSRHFDLESFDVVISTETVEHVYDWPNVFYQMMLVLKQGGLLILTTRSIGFEIHDHPYDFWRFSRQDMRHIFNAVGELLMMADDMTLGFPCGIGVVIRKTCPTSTLETWKPYLRSACNLYNVNIARRISFEEHQALKSSPEFREAYVRPELLALPFDQYQRYRLIQEVIDSLRWKTPLRILDVGGSPATLTHFLPLDQVVVADAADQGGLHLYANGRELPFSESVFDVVVTSDTLEHVPPGDRLLFLTELSRVAREAIIVGAPFDDTSVVQAEEVFQSLIWARYGQGYHFIEEHRRYGLPKLDETVASLRSSGFQTCILPNGYLYRWLLALSTFFLLQWRFHDAKLNAAANTYYNANFYRADNREPSYRKIIVAAKTRDVSDLRAELCQESSSAEGDQVAHLTLLNMFVTALVEEWSGLAQTLQAQLAEKDHVLAEREQLLAEKTGSIQALSNELNVIHGSKLWKAGVWYRGLLRKL